MPEINEITINIDCYQCGTKLEILFKLSIHHAEYAYCPDCQEGVEVRFAGTTLEINRLEQE